MAVDPVADRWADPTGVPRTDVLVDATANMFDQPSTGSANPTGSGLRIWYVEPPAGAPPSAAAWSQIDAAGPGAVVAPPVRAGRATGAVSRRDPATRESGARESGARESGARESGARESGARRRAAARAAARHGAAPQRVEKSAEPTPARQPGGPLPPPEGMARIGKRAVMLFPPLAILIGCGLRWSTRRNRRVWSRPLIIGGVGMLAIYIVLAGVLFGLGVWVYSWFV